MEQIIEFLNYLMSLITNLPDTIDNFFERFMVWCFIIYLQSKILFIELAWSISKPLIEAISMSDVVQNALSALPPDVRAALTACRFFEAINMISSAAMTRFTLGLIK